MNPAPYRQGVNYYATQYGDAAFFVLDTRAFRSPNDAEDNEDKTMLGQQQKEPDGARAATEGVQQGSSNSRGI